jgi:ribosomal protein S18 acetylase RimI-like enzyme
VITIAEIKFGEDLNPFVNIIRNSFQTVADEFGLTEENNPTNPAFIDLGKLIRLQNEAVCFYKLMVEKKPVGFIAIEESKEEKTTYYIEKVSVLPDFRHKGFGKMLMDFASKQIHNRGGRKISVALINDNLQLKRWYTKLGYKVAGLKNFHRLPFSVCFMAKELA